MALERLGLSEALSAYVDTVTPIPAHIAARYEEKAADPHAAMMTHPDLGRLLAVLTRASGGRRVLEIGTFVGVSAAWICEGLAPDGHLDALEIDPVRAADAHAWLTRAGAGERVTITVGPAADALPGLPEGAYDLAYVDADKPGYPGYLDECARLVRPGGLIVADNVLSAGRVADPQDDSPTVAAMRAFTRAAVSRPALATVLLTVGDGVTLSVRTA